MYQDLFGEGSFIGKGIYDVDAFERALQGRFPDNRILSHDLVEGCYARSGLLSDVQVYEEYPARYSADVSRRHRWIRGDWQLLRWLLPWVPGAAGRRGNPISALSRWKLFDNLRRSLVPVALTLLLLLSWALLPLPGFWTLAVVGIILIPGALACLLDLLRKPKEVLWGQHLTLGPALRLHALLAGRLHAGLPSLRGILQPGRDPAHALADAGVAPPAAGMERVQRGQTAIAVNSLAASWRTMWIGPALALAAAGLSRGRAAHRIAGGLADLGALGLSPSIAWWISRPVPPRAAHLTAEQTVFLRKLARKTWDFFETFVGPEDNWLPPDNYQEQPVARIAHRTSPTNIGLSLLANLSAYDFGYITAGQLAERTANAFHTMQALERHRGHFYNWYDTQSLKPLLPIYISTVDSGNLAGHLLTLRPGLLAMPDQPIVSPRWFDGLSDTFGILVDANGGLRCPPNWLACRRSWRHAGEQPPATLPAIRVLLERLETAATGAVNGPHRFDTRRWARALAAQCRAALEDIGSARARRVRGHPHAARSGGAARRRAAGRARAGADRGGRTAWPRRRASSRRWSTTSCSTAPVSLLTIGYNVAEHRADQSYYDLLASEARLCSFVAIAQGQLPQDNWFAMGRLLVTAGGEPMLLSWSGSMFEYLMPLVVMPTYENTLLDQTYKAAVARQIEYGEQRGVPWGVSESGYNAVDAQLNYQYRAFGVPGTGLKRGLADDLVVAPYASALALMVAPEEACANLERLSERGLRGDLRFIRSHRLYAFARAARTAPRRGSLFHGASPGHEPALVRASAAGPPDAETVRQRPACSRRPRCCCRSACRGPWRSIRAWRRFPICAPRPAAGRRRCASSATRIRRRPNCSSCRTAGTT